MMTNELYSKDLVAKLYEFQQENLLCDTVLIADDCQIWAHSVVLAAASPFAYAHLTNRQKARHGMRLDGCDSICVKAVMRYLYTGSFILPTNFQQPQAFAGILQVCEKLGINATKLNGALVKFVNINPVESFNIELGHHGLTSGSYLEESQLDAAHYWKAVSSDIVEKCENQLCENREISKLTDIDESCLAGDNGDIKLEMDVYEPEPEFIDSVETESRKSTAADVETNSTLSSYSQLKHAVLFPSYVPEVNISAAAAKNRHGTGMSILRSCHIATNFQNASMKTANKILRNTIHNSKRKTELLAKNFKNLDMAVKFHLKSSGNGIRERLKNYGKETTMCHICGKKFKWQTDLKKHMKIYQAHSALTCKECGKVLMSKRQLLAHEKLHAGHRLHICETCGKIYRYRSGLVLHSYEHTGQLPYLCDICGSGFKDFFSMGQHKKRRHSSFRQFICNECGKGFIRNDLLRQHMKVHSGVKEHICPKCGMMFGYRGNLSRHLLSHTGDKPHSCEVCGKSFNRFDHLQGHALIHRGERLHRCTECQKVFKSAILLQRHATIHSDENMHRCNICSKRFTASIRLKQHMVMHQEKQHKCHICAKTFSFERFLMGHMKKFHQGTGASSGD